MSNDMPKMSKDGFTANFSWESINWFQSGRDIELAKVNRSRFWLIMRSIVTKMYRRIERFGMKHEFLLHDSCYECGGSIIENEYDFTWEEVEPK